MYTHALLRHKFNGFNLIYLPLKRKEETKEMRKNRGRKEDTVVDVCVYPRKYFWLKMPK